MGALAAAGIVTLAQGIEGNCGVWSRAEQRLHQRKSLIVPFTLDSVSAYGSEQAHDYYNRVCSGETFVGEGRAGVAPNNRFQPTSLPHRLQLQFESACWRQGRG
jgi:hypothetical protein